jgi:hypothetical protein
VRLLPDGVLSVDGAFGQDVRGALRVDDDAASFVDDVVYAPDGRHVQYRFALRKAAEKLMDPETAISAGDAWVAPPSTWLLRPPRAVQGAFRFRVAFPPTAVFVSGTHPSGDGAPDTYEAPTSALDEASFAAFGRLAVRDILEGEAHVLVAIAPSGLKLTPEDAAGWVSRSVHAVAAYGGRFPSARTLVVVIANEASGPTRGETLGEGGPAVLVRAPRTIDAPATRDDWVVTHELLHVALPSLPRGSVWLAEGIPSYVEPIARVRVGLTTAEKVWLDLVQGLPQGLPEAGDQGLERTHTWGRTYWGGSLFCFLADVRIRERTGNGRSFDDVVRALVASGGGVESHWDVARVVLTGDRATGTDVLSALYREMALAPGTVDLDELWRRLGVVVRGETVTFDDAAPLASVRRGIAGR